MNDLVTTIIDSQSALKNVFKLYRQEGTPIPDADLLMAATAMAHNLTLKTEDQHFKRLREFGLKL